jgi:hypothetical protein
MVIIMRIALIIIVLLLSACSSLEKKGDIIVLSVDSAGSDSNRKEFCSDFDINKNEAQSFFERAQKISVKQLHDNYSFLPCFVRGKALFRKINCDWEIRAGGTGEMMCGEEVYLYGCNNCSDILR